MRQAARTDANHKAIVRALRQVGATVQTLHRVGVGCPDLLVGWQGVNYLIEVKDGDKSPSKRALTEDEQSWHDTWRGQVDIAYSVDDALWIVGMV